MEFKKSDLWAKLKKDDGGNIISWHSLLSHSADVSSVFEALLMRTKFGNRLAKLAGWEEFKPIHISRLSALAALHDAGKVNHGFQNKAWKNKYPVAGHVGPILDVLKADKNYQERILLPLGIHDLINWFDNESTVNFLCATWAHHGKPVPIQNGFRADIWEVNIDRNPIDGLRELGSAIRSWFPLAFENDSDVDPLPKNEKFIHAYNGLLTLADWLGSDDRFFDYSIYDDKYIDKARATAQRIIDAQFLNISKSRECLIRTKVSFSLFSDFEPYMIQKKCLDLQVYENGGLTILESDTGSGKTEASIARYLKLCEQNLVDGMYFAVPTRSAATQLYERVRDAVSRVFPNEESRPPVIQAVSGYIKADGIEGNALPDFKVLWPDKDEWLNERGWAAEHPKRYLTGAIVVGTIDQVLMASLKVKHAHMRMTALLRQFLVVDEVHSSDNYMTSLLKKVLDMHLQSGGHALLMSATLGAASRLSFTSTEKVPVPPLDTTLNHPYPLLTHTDGERKNFTIVEGASSGKQKNVTISCENIANKPIDIAGLAAKHASNGGRVLIIRNLVSDCIKTQKEIENLLGSESSTTLKVGNVSVPHHSRYAAADRKVLDQAIEASFGKNSQNRGLIATATQTVEQSLDIDADLLITDLCPIDVLLQRIGRLHRHDRERPVGFEFAKCIVLVPENRDLGAAINNGEGNRGKHGLGTVYDDLRVLEGTWRLIEDKKLTAWDIPKHNRMLVEKATHPHVLSAIVQELGDKWRKHQEYLDGRFFAENMQATQVTIDYDEPFEECRFGLDSAMLKTRLGQNGYRIYFPSKPMGPFNNLISELTIPAWMLDGLPDDLEVSEPDISLGNGGFSFKVAGRNFLYDRFGISLIQT